MCGITGYFALDSSFDSNRFAQANELISYRGPDDGGYLILDEQGNTHEIDNATLRDSGGQVDAVGALGFRRLAIIDLSVAGHQPMPDSSRRYWIIFNGEVYNYIELRSELENEGYVFRSDSDTEVVLTAYIHWGKDCLHRFNGMWSFCILDRSSKTLFCARDRFGIKPFNYYLDDKRFIFGSEVKQVITLLGERPETNTSTLLDFIIFGVKNHSEQTFYKDIQELRGGHCLTVSLDNKTCIESEIEQWWDLSSKVYEGTEQEAAERLLCLLKDSAKLRLRSDVATGTALSGGLDSTGLVALIDEIGDKNQNVFTVVSRDKNLDELAYASQTIEKYGLKSFKAEFGQEAIEDLERITFHHDQPVNSASIFGGWILQKLVKESGVVVNLNGQGADELMGGYSNPPHALRYLESISDLHILDAHRDLITSFRNSNRSVLGSARVFFEDIARFAFRKLTYRTVLKSRGKLINSELVKQHAGNSVFLNPRPRLNNVRSIQKQQAYTELKYRTLPALLHNVDRDSMAHSLEARVPFLDYRVAEFIFSLPSSMLTKNGYTKHVYRQAMKDRIPRRILWDNNKKGFATPANDYLETGKEYITTLLSEVEEHPVIDIKALKALTPESNVYGSPLHWRLLCTLIWDRTKQ